MRRTGSRSRLPLLRLDEKYCFSILLASATSNRRLLLLRANILVRSYISPIRSLTAIAVRSSLWPRGTPCPRSMKRGIL